MRVQNSRLLLKRSQVVSLEPTIPTGSTVHTDGTWATNDIYPGELFLNMADKKLYFGWEDVSGNTGIVLLNPWTPSTGSCIADFYVTNIYGCSPVTFHDSIQHVDCVSSGDLSVSFGLETIASGNYSAAYGVESQALGIYSFAQGFDTRAVGNYSHAEGIECQANASGSHAEGFVCIADGIYSHAEGRATQALGEYSHSGGRQTIADGAYQTVVGRFNATGATEAAFIVGGGSSDISRSNLFLVEPDSSKVTCTATLETEQLIVNDSVTFNSIPFYTDDAAAGVGGLSTGKLYITNGSGASPLNVAGILMIKL